MKPNAVESSGKMSTDFFLQVSLDLTGFGDFVATFSMTLQED